MRPIDTSPIDLFFWLFAFAALALLGIALIAREVVSRIKAGPVRFRLPLASLARPPQRITSNARERFSLPASVYHALYDLYNVESIAAGSVSASFFSGPAYAISLGSAGETRIAGWCSPRGCSPW